MSDLVSSVVEDEKVSEGLGEEDRAGDGGGEGKDYIPTHQCTRLADFDVRGSVSKGVSKQCPSGRKRRNLVR